MMTVSQLNAHADDIEVNGLLSEAVLTDANDEDGSGVMGKVCGVYKKVRPFLEVVTKLFFLPQKWRQPIVALMVVMDGLCPDQ